MDEKSKLFAFLEKKKDSTYKTQNLFPSNKTALAKIELLKEIYEFFGFNFLSVAFLREKEGKYWKSLIKVFKDEKDGLRLMMHSLKHHYRRLKSYDILRIRNVTYVIPKQ